LGDSASAGTRQRRRAGARAPTWWDIHQDRVVGILLFLPLATLIVGLTVYPITRVLTASVYQQGLYSQVAEYVGLRNFVAVWQSEAFMRSIQNTLVFTFGGLAIQMVVGLLIALLVNARFPLRSPVRGAMLFSYLVPYVVAALTWRFMMSDATGILNYLIRTSGLGIPASWFGSPDYAMLGVILVNAWKNFPFMVLVFLAQLQSIDPQLYEAGAVDGTSRWGAFRYITFPSLLPIILVVGMLRTIWNFNNFEVVFLLTQGGPLGRTETLPLLIYRFIFGEFSLGRGAALAVFVFLILVVMSLIYWRLYERAQGKFE
jgi:multiple sugar transport system permease protein